MKEKILYVKFDKKPLVRPRIADPADKKKDIISKDGIKRTLYDDKIKFPCKLDNTVNIIIATTIREIKIKIQAGYTYDGASIPKLLHSTIGSNTDPQFLVPALLHDYLLEKMQSIYKEYFSDLSYKDFRKLTTDIFEWELAYYGAKSVKIKIMGKSVQFWQCTGANKQWVELKEV